MIVEAARNGATHGKIQGLYSDELTFRQEFEESNTRPGALVRPHQKEIERLKYLDLSPDDEEWFVSECKTAALTPMITVFTHKGLDRAIAAGFKSFKIASYDCASRALIERIVPHADELVISTGATKWDEITTTAELVQQNKKSETQVALLHAKTIYPTPISRLNISRMFYLKYFGWEIGLSDHTQPEVDGLLASKAAIFMGAQYIERHFTILDRDKTKDGPVSINPSELKELYDFSLQSQEFMHQELSAELGQGRLLFENPDLECDSDEIRNSTYFRGRVASWREGKQIPSWDKWI